MCIKHLNLLKELKDERIALLEIRNHIGWYFKGMKNANELKNKVYQTKNIRDIISTYNHLASLKIHNYNLLLIKYFHI